MKYSFLFFISCFLAFNISAQQTETPYCHSSISFNLPDAHRVEIFVDGVNFGFLDDQRVVKNIPNGKRFIQVLKKYSQGKRKPITIFEGFVVFDECQDIKATINRDKTLLINSVVFLESKEDFSYLPTYYVNDSSTHHDANGVYTEQSTPPVPNNYPQQIEPNQTVVRPISDGSFHFFMESIRIMSHDHSKKEIAEMGISSNLFLAAQVKEMLTLFLHDHTKLEVAKMAFHKTVDPQNYTLLFNSFSHDHSRQELSRYIRSHY